MVQFNVDRTASALQRQLSDSELATAGVIASATAGGVIISQRVADRLLPKLDLEPNPSNLTEAAGSAGVKSLIGAAFTYGAGRFSGLATVAMAFLAVGSFASAGVDLFGQFVEVPELASSRKTRSTSTNTSTATQMTRHTATTATTGNPTPSTAAETASSPSW